MIQLCNCRNKVCCPLEGKCRKGSIVYKACLISGNVANNYYGYCETEFKARFYNHNQSFKYRRKSNAPNSPKLFGWPRRGKKPRIKWSIVVHTAPYRPGARFCYLCLTEKLAILQADANSTLNKRTELNGKCRHANKFKLRNFC